MRPGADRALKDGRRRGMYTDRGAASSQCEPQFDTYLPAPALRARAASHPWGENLSIQTEARGLNPRIWPATACIRVRQEGRDIHVLRVRRQRSDRGTGGRGRDSVIFQRPIAAVYNGQVWTTGESGGMTAADNQCAISVID